MPESSSIDTVIEVVEKWQHHDSNSRWLFVNISPLCIYSRVVCVNSITLELFLTKLNGLDSWCMGAVNAHLEDKYKEKICMIASSEFSSLKYHILIIIKSLFGLYTSGLWYY